MFLFPQDANAGTASKVADKTIEYTAKTVYYVTKYTLKAGWFIIKKTGKGIKVISKSIFSGTKDAFDGHKQEESIDTLPPPPSHL